MREIGRFPGGQEKVPLGLGEKTLSLQVADKHLFIRLLDRGFPEYRRILPEGFAYRFAVNRKDAYRHPEAHRPAFLGPSKA